MAPGMTFCTKVVQSTQPYGLFRAETSSPPPTWRIGHCRARRFTGSPWAAHYSRIRGKEVRGPGHMATAARARPAALATVRDFRSTGGTVHVRTITVSLGALA